MKNRIVTCFTFIAVVFLILSPRITCAADTMGELNIDLEISATSLHEWMPSVAYNSIDNEFLVLWHTTGVRELGGENMYSLHGQRIDPQGKFVGEQVHPITSIGPERRILPRAAHNPFTNQYMVSFVMGQEVTDWDPFITLMDHEGGSMYGPVAISEQPTKANHATIAFNSNRRQYLIVYNDSRNGNADVFGVIIDEAGSIVKGDFAVNTSKGEQMNPYVCYNSTDDTYLVNWEDFRNVSTWQEPGDIYGALLNGDGAIIKNDIAMCDDHGMPNAGDQRVQNIAYNSDRNEFLATWLDTRPSLDGSGIMGRIINPDGTPAGQDFVVADGPGGQSFPHVVYVEKRKKYFAIWDDSRNNATTGGDVYARWLDATGQPEGADFPICTQQGSQHYSDLAYSPLMDRFLIAWRDDVEEAPVEGGSGHIKESGGNVMGKVYGAPSFITGRIVEQGTGTPVDGARVIIMGLPFLSRETANSSGWFNLAQDNQRTGNYFIMAYKRGYRMGFASLAYSGEPLQITIEMVKK